MDEIGVRIQEKGQVTIPRQIRKKLNLKRGDLVVFVETEAGVIVKPATVVATDELRAKVTAVVRSIRSRSGNTPQYLGPLISGTASCKPTPGLHDANHKSGFLSLGVRGLL